MQNTTTSLITAPLVGASSHPTHQRNNRLVNLLNISIEALTKHFQLTRQAIINALHPALLLLTVLS